MQYSHYQEAIFDFIANGKGSGEVIAPAGAGKTFTGVQAVRRIPRGMSGPNITFLAFNKHIQVELAEKLPDYAQALTYHSFGLRSIPGRPKIDGRKNYSLLKGKFRDGNVYPVYPTIDRIAGLFKGNLLTTVNRETVNQVVDQYAIEMGDEDEHFYDEIVEGVDYLLQPEHVRRLNVIDFDDMIWYPVIENLPIPSVDYLLVDEYQDTNPAQEELVYRAKNHHGRVLAIGDPKQAIYGWRGAGTQSMENYVKRMNATVLPLSITYRCPLSVIRLVNETFPDIPFEAAPNAIEGAVQSFPETQALARMQDGDMVLCRLNAPLVRPAMTLLKQGRKAIIKGRDIGKNLLDLIRKVERTYGSTSLVEFLADLEDYTRKEAEKLNRLERHSQATLLEDKSETLYAFADGARTVDDIRNAIDKIFSDDREGVTFSTGHKAKGLEAERVYLLHPEMFPFKRAKSEEAKKQERNLQYVAYTRAKVELNFITG